MSSNRSFVELLDAVARAIDRLPARIATEAVNFSKARFVKQNWHDESPLPWPPRKRARRGSRARQRGAVLVDSGRLKRSIRVISASPERIVIGTDVQYAQIHNDGLDAVKPVKAHSRRSRKGNIHTVRAHSRKVKMPQRRFIGESAELARKIENLITGEITRAVNEL
jgi:phage gpG-like protein